MWNALNKTDRDIFRKLNFSVQNCPKQTYKRFVCLQVGYGVPVKQIGDSPQQFGGEKVAFELFVAAVEHKLEHDFDEHYHHLRIIRD